MIIEAIRITGELLPGLTTEHQSRHYLIERRLNPIGSLSDGHIKRDTNFFDSR